MLSAAHHHIRHFSLLDLQIRLRLKHLAHLQPVGLLVALRPRRPDGGPTRSVEQPKLDSDRIRDLAHDAAKRIHFPHQVPLSDAANRRITRHLRDQIDVQSIKSGLQPHASSRHRRFASGMPSPHHHHLEMFVKRLHVRLFGTTQQQKTSGNTTSLIVTTLDRNDVRRSNDLCGFCAKNLIAQRTWRAAEELGLRIRTSLKAARKWAPLFLQPRSSDTGKPGLSLDAMIQSLNLSSSWELLCYFIHPLGIERNMPPDLLNSGKRILVRPHRIDGLLSASGNAVVIAIAFVRTVSGVIGPFQLRKINVLTWNVLNGRIRRFA